MLGFADRPINYLTVPQNKLHLNKQFKELKPGTTLNQNDFEDLSLKELWKVPLQKQELHSDQFLEYRILPQQKIEEDCRVYLFL